MYPSEDDVQKEIEKHEKAHKIIVIIATVSLFLYTAWGIIIYPTLQH